MTAVDMERNPVMTRPTRDSLPPITLEARRRRAWETFRPKPIPAAMDPEAVPDAPAEEAEPVVATCRFR